MSTRVVVIALVAFTIGALSPSFIDWQQADARQRDQILGYYAVMFGVIIVFGQFDSAR